MVCSVLSGAKNMSNIGSCSVLKTPSSSVLVKGSCACKLVIIKACKGPSTVAGSSLFSLICGFRCCSIGYTELLSANTTILYWVLVFRKSNAAFT